MVLDFKLMERFLMLENNNNGSNNNDNNSNNNVAGMNALDFSANAPWGGKKKGGTRTSWGELSGRGAKNEENKNTLRDVLNIFALHLRYFFFGGGAFSLRGTF